MYTMKWVLSAPVYDEPVFHSPAAVWGVLAAVADQVVKYHRTDLYYDALTVEAYLNGEVFEEKKFWYSVGEYGTSISTEGPCFEREFTFQVRIRIQDNRWHMDMRWSPPSERIDVLNSDGWGAIDMLSAFGVSEAEVDRFWKMYLSLAQVKTTNAEGPTLDASIS